MNTKGWTAMTDVEKKVRSFIEDNFLFRDDRVALSDGESLLDAGLIDSTGILELVAFLEGEFAIQMADADIVPANLDSIKSIVAYVQGKMAKQAAA
jgi:acyl carrier protein